MYADEEEFDMLRFGIGEWKRVAPYLICEFYPLTPWHKESDNGGFCAFCYYDPESESGVLLAFRQEACATDTLRLTLPFVSEDERYLLSDEDSGEMTEAGNRLKLTFDSQRSSRLLWLRKKQ